MKKKKIIKINTKPRSLKEFAEEHVYGDVLVERIKEAELSNYEKVMYEERNLKI